MLDILYDLAKSKEYALFYTNHQSDSFKFGCVLAVNENEVALQELSPDGKDDGIVVMSSERIFRVETNCRYVDKMLKLCSDSKIVDWLKPIDANNIFLSILCNPILKDRIISIELNDSGVYDVCGFIEQIQNDQCTIRQVDNYGSEDGVTYFSLSNISEIEISSDIEKRIEKLWKINRKS